NMLFMRKLKKGKNAKELARTVIHLLSPFKDHIKSITTDNGTEFACHEMIAKSLGSPSILRNHMLHGKRGYKKC
ncbi:hypothetical protein O3685_13585, partial [Prevotella jejuni]